jgi:hypothetical protein
MRVVVSLVQKLNQFYGDFSSKEILQHLHAKMNSSGFLQCVAKREVRTIAFVKNGRYGRRSPLNRALSSLKMCSYLCPSFSLDALARAVIYPDGNANGGTYGYDGANRLYPSCPHLRREVEADCPDHQPSDTGEANA